MKANGYCKIRVRHYQATRSHTPEETILHRRHRGNIKSTSKGTDRIHHVQNLRVLQWRSPVNTNAAEGSTQSRNSLTGRAAISNPDAGPFPTPRPFLSDLCVMTAR